MIKSMTAYAKSEKTSAMLSVSIEIRSYNSRYLDIVLRLSHEYAPLEEKIKKIIAKHINRGRLEVHVTIKDESEADIVYEVDFPRAKAYHKALLTLKNALYIERSLNMDHLLNNNSLVRLLESEKDMIALWPVVNDSLLACLKQIDSMRRQEGEFIAKDFQQRLDLIEKRLAQIKASSKGLLEMYRDRLNERIAVLTKGIVTLEPERIAQEAALLADKSDISEELVRVESHLLQFRKFMADPEPSGRKLNFLLQEFNREFNTIGSKGGKSEISHLIVELKAEIEKLREQVQNVE
jgi:uncharacterized protein (TIGR00255 family)